MTAQASPAETTDRNGWAVAALAGQFAQEILKGIQLGRMIQALSELSNDQLEQFGVKRSDIPQHARRLLADR